MILTFKRQIKKRRMSMRELITQDPTTTSLSEMRRMDSEIDELEKKREVY